MEYGTAVPTLEPKWPISSTRVAVEVQKKTAELIANHQHAARPCLQQNGDSLDGRVRDVETRCNEVVRHVSVVGHRRRRYGFLDCLFDRILPCFENGTGA